MVCLSCPILPIHVQFLKVLSVKFLQQLRFKVKANMAKIITTFLDSTNLPYFLHNRSNLILIYNVRNFHNSYNLCNIFFDNSDLIYRRLVQRVV